MTSDRIPFIPSFLSHRSTLATKACFHASSPSNPSARQAAADLSRPGLIGPSFKPVACATAGLVCWSARLSFHVSNSFGLSPSCYLDLIEGLLLRGLDKVPATSSVGSPSPGGKRRQSTPNALKEALSGHICSSRMRVSALGSASPDSHLCTFLSRVPSRVAKAYWVSPRRSRSS